MVKKQKRRSSHGVTSMMVLDALFRLHARDRRWVEVSRVDLLKALKLPETTVDDRLRTLLDQGLVQRVRRGHYLPTPSSDRQVPLNLPHGTKKITIFPNGVQLEETWKRGDRLS